MEVLFVLLFFMFLVLFVVGLINPKVLFWSRTKKRKGAFWYLLVSFVCMIVAVAVTPPVSLPVDSANSQVASSMLEVSSQISSAAPVSSADPVSSQKPVSSLTAVSSRAPASSAPPASSAAASKSAASSRASASKAPETKQSKPATTKNKTTSEKAKNNFNTYNNEEQQNTDGYVINTSTKKFHRPSCRYVPKIAPKNYKTVSTRQEAINEGYTPCKVCNP